MAQILKQRCIDPASVEKKDIQSLEEMLASHTWGIESIQNKPGGIFIKYVCKDCSVERFAFAEYIPK